MYLPEVEKKLKDHAIQSVVIFGIEVNLFLLLVWDIKYTSESRLLPPNGFGPFETRL